MAFHYQSRMYAANGAIEMPVLKSGLFGLHDGVRKFRSEPDMAMILILFKPESAAAFFNIPLHELYCNASRLDNFIHPEKVMEVEDRLQAAGSLFDKITTVEKFLCGIAVSKRKDAIVEQAVQQIRLSKGDIKIKQLAEALCISESRFEKRFRASVGTTPKRFASVIRFRTIIQSYRQMETFTGAAYEAGYFDQAHFVRDFKSFTGVSPFRFFKAKDNNSPVFLPF